METPQVLIGSLAVKVQEEKDEKKKRSRKNKPRNMAYPCKRTVRESMDRHFGAKNLLDEVPMCRASRVRKVARSRGVSTRRVNAWRAEGRENLVKYSNGRQFLETLRASCGDLVSERPIISEKGITANRRAVAMFTSHSIYLRIRDIVERNATHLTHPMPLRERSYTPKHPTVLALLDATGDGHLWETMKARENFLVVAEESSREGVGVLRIPLPAPVQVDLSVPVLVARFDSLLDAPESSWRSVRGTKNGTMQLFLDREGINTATLQMLDEKVDRDNKKKNDGEQDGNKILAKLVAVGDDGVDLSGAEDVVSASVSDGDDRLTRVIVSRLRGTCLEYVEGRWDV